MSNLEYVKYRKPNETHKRRGGEQFFTPEQLMNVWVYVQTGIAQEKSNAYRFCTKKRHIYWLQGGSRAPMCDDDGNPISPELMDRPLVLHCANGRTLWRRYQQAQTFLKKESEAYRLLSQKSDHAGKFVRTSPTEVSWRSEVNSAIARLN